MQYVEQRKKLPPRLKIPYKRSEKSLEEGKELDLGDRVSYFGSLSTSGNLRVYNRSEDIEIKGPKEFFYLFTKHRHSILHMPRELISILWKGFSETFQIGIVEFPELGVNEYGYTITTRAPSKINIHGAGGWHTVWIYQGKNISPLEADPETFTDEFLIDLPRLTSIQPSLISYAQTGRTFLFGLGGSDYEEIRLEFSRSRKLGREDPKTLEDFYSACKRAVMACKKLGTIPPSWSEDMVKAYLEAASRAPTMNPFLTYVDRSPEFDPYANYAVYLAEVTMPTLWPFAPHTFRAGDDSEGYGIYSPTGGPQVCLVGQRRASLWSELKIPFKVHKAYKIIPLSDKYAYGELEPFRERASMLSYIIDNFQSRLPHINFKAFYYAPVGSLLTTYTSLESNGDENFNALDVFNPILELFIYEWVGNKTWARLLTHPPAHHQALRIDASTVEDYKGYKSDGSRLFLPKPDYPAEMFFANPRQKDKDTVKSPHYRTIVRRAADKGEDRAYEVKEVIGTLKMVHQGLISLKDYGKVVRVKNLLSLDGENRVPEDGKKILPKHLVDDQVNLVDPSIEQVARLEDGKPGVRSYKDE